MLVSSGLTKNGLFEIIVDQCGVCCLRLKVNSVFCVQCVIWVLGRCTGVKWVTAHYSRNLACGKCDGHFLNPWRR